MLLLVSLPHDTIPVRVSPIDTVGDFKRAVKNIAPSADGMCVVFKDRLLDDNWTLQTCGVCENSALFMVPYSEGDERILIKAAEETFALDVKFHYSILEVKQLIYEKKGLSKPEHQTLLFHNEILRNGAKLEDYSIRSGSVVQLASPQEGNIPIFVRILGKLIPVSVNPTDTVETVKWLVHATEGGIPDEQTLALDGERLKDERTLESYGIGTNSILDTVAAAPQGMQIFVTFVSGGKTFALIVDPFGTVESLKEKIELREGIPVKMQRLIFAGKELSNEQTIEYYGIQKGRTVHLVMRVLGGNDEH